MNVAPPYPPHGIHAGLQSRRDRRPTPVGHPWRSRLLQQSQHVVPKRGAIGERLIQQAFQSPEREAFTPLAYRGDRDTQVLRHLLNLLALQAS